MLRYTLARLLLYIPVIVLALSGVFFASALLPDYAERRVAASATGGAARAEALAALRRELGTDGPLLTRYPRFLLDTARLDLGHSLLTRRPVTEELRRRLGPSLQLGALQVLIAVAIGLPLGVIAAIRQGSAVDHAARALATAWQAIPSFYLAALLLIALPRAIGWTPPVTNMFWRGPLEDPWRNVQYLAVPALAGGVGAAASIMRLLRSQLLDVLRQDYVRTAWAKGLSHRTVIRRHALKNALIPVLTLVGLLVGTLVSGNVVLESIFGIPGIGLLAVTAVRQNDFPVVRGIVLLVATAVVLANLVVDLAYAWLDPRLRFTEAAR